MSTQTTPKCLRGRSDCEPLANISSDFEAEGDEALQSFICVGLNDPTIRIINQDRFTLCWKNGEVDERGHWDERDLLDTMSVIAQALSIDANMRNNVED